MKLLILALCAFFLTSGCARLKWFDRSDKKQNERPVVPSTETPVITPSTVPIGRVAMVNRPARFAVLQFSFGEVPPIDQRLNAYRNGLKVGELKVTGPQKDDNTVADIVAGEVKIDDEVRED